MEKHTRGLKTERIFCKSKKNNEPFEVIAFSDNQVVLRNLVDDSGRVTIHHAVDWSNDYETITQGEVFDFIDNNDDKQHADMMDRLGIGYICPFCGGKLHWESDFMASEVHGMYNCYIEITDKSRIEEMTEHFDEYCGRGMAGTTDDIEKENDKYNETGYYQYMYMKEIKTVDGQDTVTYYEADDAVIGIYRCSNCGKSYEIQDCLPSEQADYPYFQD